MTRSALAVVPTSVRTWLLLPLIAGLSAFGATLSAQSAGRGSKGDSSNATTVGSDAATQRLMGRLSALSADSMEGRRAGSAGSARARGWIERELKAIGVSPMGATFEQPVRLRPRTGFDTLGANIIARIPGRNSTASAIVLSAHYDHLGTRNGDVFNGADDNASGCIALLTIAERVLKSSLDHDVIVAFFDAEESDLAGAREFVRAPPVPLSRVAININLDMVSRQDGGALWVSGVSKSPFLKDVVEPVAVASRVPVRFGHDTKNLKPGDDWTESSDHGAFFQKGVPFLYLGVEDHADYHKASDEASKVDPAFYAGVVDFAEHLVRAVDSAVSRFPVR